MALIYTLTNDNDNLKYLCGYLIYTKYKEMRIFMNTQLHQNTQSATQDNVSSDTRNINADDIIVRAYTSDDVSSMVSIWNEVVKDGVAFPQLDELNEQTGTDFFKEQTYCAVACHSKTGEVLGMYILHPNNIGRCGHIANASYAVCSRARGLHIGEKLVRDCISEAHAHNFKILQFNAVVATNTHARHLYERIGFKQLGTIPGGFLMDDGHYEDICPYYIEV